MEKGFRPDQTKQPKKREVGKEAIKGAEKLAEEPKKERKTLESGRQILKGYAYEEAVPDFLTREEFTANITESAITVAANLVASAGRESVKPTQRRDAAREIIAKLDLSKEDAKSLEGYVKNLLVVAELGKKDPEGLDEDQKSFLYAAQKGVDRFELGKTLDKVRKSKLKPVQTSAA